MPFFVIISKMSFVPVFTNKNFNAVLEPNPLAVGHTLIFPKKKIDYLFDISDHDLKEMMVFSKKIARAVKQAFPCEKIGVLVYGLKTRHAHIHLVPISGKNGEFHLFRKRKKASLKELALVAQKIKKIIS